MLTSALGQLAGVRGEDTNLTRDVTILLADLRGFTTISANYPAVVVLELLNRCFVRMSEIIFQHHGGIDKFMGDSILVIFEAGENDNNESVKRALHCAVDMQLAMEELNQQHREEGWPEMYFGIGINTGRVMAALLGSDLYSEHTVIGDEVNLASRIESFSLRGQVLISQSTYERADGFVKCGESMDEFVKGKSKLVVLREVLGIPSLGKEIPRQEVRRSPRVDVMLPMHYRVVGNDFVVPETYEGRPQHRLAGLAGPPAIAVSGWCSSSAYPLVGQRLRGVCRKVVVVCTEGHCVGIGRAGNDSRRSSACSC